MNNELGRKITSLTLMTIMVAGGMTFAFPGFMPAAHAANANLFVSAENSQFDNYMAGPQVIEVVVIDSDINDTDQAKGEPDVTVNGKILRMVQAVDGNWYGYFADRDQAQIADSTTDIVGSGLDFGKFCSATSAGSVDVLGGAARITFTDTVGVALPSNPIGGVNGIGAGEITADCSAVGSDNENNVVRESKSPVAAANTVQAGQINIDPDGWPFVQLYVLSPGGNVVVQYNKGGGAQSTTLTFDTVDQYAGATLDRTTYPQGAEVHATITDLWLNIDPTDEDSWTFATSSDGADSFYQVFDENGGSGGEALSTTNTLGDLMCADNCVLLLDLNAQSVTNPVLTLQDNDDSILDQLGADGNVNDATAFGVKSEPDKLGMGSVPVTITELGPNSGVFGTYDEADVSVLKITDDAARRTSATFDYNASPVSIVVDFGWSEVDIQPVDDEWNSGEEIPVIITDSDFNKNSRADEDLVLSDPNVTFIPALTTGDPFTLGEGTDFLQVSTYNDTLAPTGGIAGSTGVTALAGGNTTLGGNGTGTATVDLFSERALVAITTKDNPTSSVSAILIDLETTRAELNATINDNRNLGTGFTGFNLFNYDVRSFGPAVGSVDIFLVSDTNAILDGFAPAEDDDVNDGVFTLMLVDGGSGQGLVSLDDDTMKVALFDVTSAATTQNIGLIFQFDPPVAALDAIYPIVADFFSFGFSDDGVQASERTANQIIRIEAEESGDNTGIFEGSLEYIMVNQLNISVESTYLGLGTIASDPSFIVIEDLTDEDAPRVTISDLGADGVVAYISDQEEAPSHSGVVSFNADSYKQADTVEITLEDLDLNTDSSLIDIYTTVKTDGNSGSDNDQVGIDVPESLEGLSFGSLGFLLGVTFDDVKWQNTGDGCDAAYDDGLFATGFTLVETGPATGTFFGDFEIPTDWCRVNAAIDDDGVAQPETVTGLDIEVNYVDFRDASGEIIEVGDSAGVRANTGSISLDRTVYPVPFGVVADNLGLNTSEAPNGRSIFPLHAAGMGDDGSILDTTEILPSGDLTVHIRVNDPDADLNPVGEDALASNTKGTLVGPVKISVIRGSDEVVLGYAGGPTESNGRIDVGDSDATAARQLGPISEIAPSAGIFELDLTIRYTDGPSSTTCPATGSTGFTSLDGTDSGLETSRFNVGSGNGNYCILQGDILQVEYTDPADASGDVNTVTDSATFDLRNGVLQSDKSVYIIGSDMILTLIEPDLDLDNDGAETYDLDLIEWDSDAATTAMGDLGGSSNQASFDPEPTDFRETGDSTGIFQIIIEIPESLDGDNLERGEEITLEYTDWGPSGADYVGNEDEDVNITVYTSNFGATVELDQKVYTWTDKVYITIVAPDHNFDGDLVDEIGDSPSDPIKVSTRGFDLDNYKLVETGTDTGIFTGEVILTGFTTHDADGDGSENDATGITSGDGGGPTDGTLATDDDDGLTVSFEFSEDETVVGSSLIRWNIGETQWLEASYPASGTGVVRIIDPDMNLNPEAVDNFDVDVWSDSDAGGVDLTVTETNEATGIFEGTVFFTTTDESSGHRLRVAEGDTVTAEYEDNTLPDPFTTADELDITATTLIGTVVPPLERAPATNLRTVDAFGNSLDAVSVDQQVQITADLANGQDRKQVFAYLVQIQDGNGVTVSLAWITGSLSSGQSFSPALSWIPTEAGSYTATAFVWESVDNPTALSPPVSTTISVS